MVLGDYIFKIPYDKTIEFINNLTQQQQNMLYSKYDISESVNGVKELADIVSDQDLIDLGYDDFDDNSIIIENKENCIDDEEYDASVDDVIDYLITLDEDVLFDLLHEYDAYTIEDLAIAITDTKLEQLGFNCEKYNDDIEDEEYTSFSSPEETFDYIFGMLPEYEENLDFLEDIDSDIPYYIIDSENLIFATDDEVDFQRFKECLDPNLVQYCECLTTESTPIKFKITPYNYNQKEISEEVVINDELNPLLFDENHKLKEDVKNQILEYIDGFSHLMQEKNILVDYTDINLIGSNAGYLYTPDSDIDIHLIWASPMDPDNFEQMRAEFTDYTLNNPLYIGNSSIELNLEDGYNMQADSARRYSLLTDTWLDDSDKNEIYTVDDLAKVEGYEKIVDDLTQQIDDIIAADEYADAVALKQEIRKNRSEDLATQGSLSMGNVVFKELRNNGAYGKLRNYIKEKETKIIDDGNE